MIVLAFSIVPASFILLLIDEKTSQSKHLQFVSGVDPVLYWIINYLWDLVRLKFLNPASNEIRQNFLFERF